MTPTDYTYFRTNIADEFRGVPPTRMTYEQVIALLGTTAKNPLAKMQSIIRGKHIRNKFGIYWAEKNV